MSEAPGSKLSAQSLRKKYKARTVVEDVSFEVKSGEVVGLLGPNGAGKTTCFYMIVGLVPADGGDGGCSLALLRSCGRRVSFFFSARASRWWREQQCTEEREEGNDGFFFDVAADVSLDNPPLLLFSLSFPILLPLRPPPFSL